MNKDRIARMDKDWVKTWHILRLECHDRLRRFLDSAFTRTWSEDLYYQVYDPPDQPSHQYDGEDQTNINGAFRKAYIKFLDVTLKGTRLEGYNAMSEWAMLQDRTAKIGPEGILKLLRSGDLKIHGGTATWSRQQRAKSLYENPHLRQVIERICHGIDGRTPDQLERSELVSRFKDAQEFGRKEGLEPTLSLCSKFAHIYDPKRWAILNIRSNAEVAWNLGIKIMDVHNPEEYLGYCDALEELRRDKQLPDLNMVDILFSNIYHELHSAGKGL